MIPADVRVIESKDLFVSQSSLTGESDAIEKCAVLAEDRHRSGSVVELDDICFMGSNVVSGSARAIVFGTGEIPIWAPSPGVSSAYVRRRHSIKESAMSVFC